MDKLKLNDRVKVVKPTKYSNNTKNRISRIIQIINGYLHGFGNCTIYFVGTKEELENDDGRFEHITSIKKLK